MLAVPSPLRRYQREAIRGLHQAHRTSDRALVQMCCGSGKTRVFTEMLLGHRGRVTHDQRDEARRELDEAICQLDELGNWETNRHAGRWRSWPALA